MKNLKPLLLLIPILYCNSTAADVAGADIKILSGIYAKTVEQIKILRDDLEQMKFLSDTAKQTTELMGAVQEEYHFVQNFNLNNEINNIVSDFADLTYLDELAEAKNPEDKYNLIRGEIDKRFKEEEQSGSPGMTKQEKEALEARLRALEAYEVMRDKYMKEAINPTSKTDKDLQRNISSSTSTLAALALEDKIKQKEQELLAKEKLMDQMRWDAEFTNYLRNQ